MLLLQALSRLVVLQPARRQRDQPAGASLLVRDLRMLIALRADFPDDAHRPGSQPLAPRPAARCQLPPGHRAAVPQPEYFDIAAREVQGALEADLKRPYYIDNNVGGGQMLIEIQLERRRGAWKRWCRICA